MVFLKNVNLYHTASVTVVLLALRLLPLCQRYTVQSKARDERCLLTQGPLQPTVGDPASAGGLD